MSTDWHLQAAECSPTSIACQLDRIADLMAEPDYGTFWSTLLATVIGAAVAAAIGLYVARSERPQPFFRAEAVRTAGWQLWEGVATIEVVLWNIGDGPAYDVRMQVQGGLEDRDEEKSAKLEPGASISGWIEVHGSGDTRYDMRTNESSDNRVATWPSTAAVLVSWQQPPQRGKQRHLTMKLDNPYPAKTA